MHMRLNIHAHKILIYLNKSKKNILNVSFSNGQAIHHSRLQAARTKACVGILGTLTEKYRQYIQQLKSLGKTEREKGSRA